MSKFAVPRGTADILPEDVTTWQELEARARKVIQSYGYREIRTPIFEDSELFARSMGQTTDVVQKQILNLAAQKADLNDPISLSGLGLRPENTASVVRAYIENRLDKVQALSKLYYFGPMFRGERPQKGRLRQFHQIGVEAIGPDTSIPQLDAEIISLSVHVVKALGVKNFKLKINSLGSAQDKEFFSQRLREIIKPHVKKLDADDQVRFDRNVFRVMDSKSRTTQSVLKKLDFSTVQLSAESQKHFDVVQKSLDSLGVVYEVDPCLVRGLDYYTHTVFELSCPDLGSQDAIGAGGRYNDLVAQLDGPDVDACGFALGVERILLALGEAKKSLPRIDAYMVSLEEETFSFCFQWVHKLRQAGIGTDMNYRLGSAKSQMRQANKAGARFVVLVGENEMKNQTFTVKDMESGEQIEIAQQNLMEQLKKKLGK